MSSPSSNNGDNDAWPLGCARKLTSGRPSRAAPLADPDLLCDSDDDDHLLIPEHLLNPMI